MARMLIDTDTATDDAVALLMALRNPDVTVEAITVVAGNVDVDKAVQNALYTVEISGVSAPVYEGAAAPLMRELEPATEIHGADGMGDCGLPLSGRAPEPGRAVDVIVDTILGSPGEITLVTLGPLTNVATALLRAPEIARAVPRVVVMGGTGCGGPGNVTALAEYNFWADPEAARIVARSGMPVEYVGWEISLESATVTAERARQIRALGTPLAEFALAVGAHVAEVVARHPAMEGPSLPDPIAMAHAIDPSVALTSYLPVEVLAVDGPARGAMSADRLGFSEAAANATVVTHYPSQRFFELLFDALRG